MSKFQFLNRIDYSKINVEWNDIKKEEEVFKKPFKCTNCQISYSFEYLIQKNTLNKNCFVHLASFDAKEGKWKCCGSSIHIMGCSKQMHDLKIHHQLSSLSPFPYLVKTTEYPHIFNEKTYDNYFFQIPLHIWLKIIKKKFARKEDIPLKLFDNTIHDIVFFKSKREYDDHFSNRKGSSIHVNGKEYKITSSKETSDQLILYVDDEDEDEDVNGMEEDEYDDSFTRYAIVKYYTYFQVN